MARLMRYKDSTLTEAGVFEKLRAQLWDTASQSPDKWLEALPDSIWDPATDGKRGKGPIKLPASKGNKFEQLLPRLPEAFSQVEQAIETAGCMKGHQLELDYLIEHNISFKDWQQLELPATSQDDPIVLLIPQDSELLIK